MVSSDFSLRTYAVDAAAALASCRTNLHGLFFASAWGFGGDLGGQRGTKPWDDCRFCLARKPEKLGLDPVKDVSLRSIGVLYDRIAALEGYQVVVEEMASTNPKATAVSVRDLIDVRFVKELEDGGFIASLYKK